MARMILVHGDKGGTGKSTAARAILDWRIRNGRKVQAFDCDQRNSQLYRYYNPIHPITRVDILNRSGLDAALDALSSGTDVLVDLPAGAGDAIETNLSTLGLGDALVELKARLSLVFVITRVKDSVNALRLAGMAFGDMPVDYIVIKNLYFGDTDKFTRYNNSKTRELILSLGGQEICLPELLDEVYDLLDDRNMPFLKVAESEEVPFSMRSRVKTWQRAFDAELAKVGHLL